MGQLIPDPDKMVFENLERWVVEHERRSGEMERTISTLSERVKRLERRDASSFRLAIWMWVSVAILILGWAFEKLGIVG